MNQIRRLGKCSYEDAWKIQLELVDERAEEKISNTLVTVEHFPVFTLGKKSPEVKASHFPQEIAGVPVHLVERGGEATYHGPGQLVIYPIFLLDAKFGPKAFLRLMEEAMIDVLKEYGVNAYWIEGKTGVWLQHQNLERKISSLGIAVRKNVSYHGLALNVTTDLSYFHKISPCGFAPTVMTNLLEVLGKEIPLEEISAQLEQRIFERFGAK